MLYLTPAGLGGPTLVTDQTLKKEQLATQGWLVHPQVNRLAGFDGALLHGVVPGRGVPMMLSGSDEQEQQEGSTSTSSSQQTGAPRRITFMAAFWRGPMSTKPRADRMPGSSQPIRKCWLAFDYHHCVDMPLPPPAVPSHAWFCWWQHRPRPFVSEDTRGLLYLQHPGGARIERKADSGHGVHQKRRQFL